MNIKRFKNFLLEWIENVNEILTDFFRKHRLIFSLILFIINILTIGYLIYNLYYIVSLQDWPYKFGPKPSYRNHVDWLVWYIPQLGIISVLNPYTIYVIHYFSSLYVLLVLILNFIFIYFYYKYYIFVRREPNITNVFWILGFFILLIIHYNLVLYYVPDYNDKFFHWLILPFLPIWSTIYFSLIYKEETEQERKLRERKEKERVDKYG